MCIFAGKNDSHILTASDLTQSGHERGTKKDVNPCTGNLTPEAAWVS